MNERTKICKDHNISVKALWIEILPELKLKQYNWQISKSCKQCGYSYTLPIETR